MFKIFLQLKAEFYDADNDLVNKMLAKKIKTMGGRALASIMELIPVDEKGHKTIMEYTSIEFDAKFEDKLFSFKNIRRVR